MIKYTSVTRKVSTVEIALTCSADIGKMLVMHNVLHLVQNLLSCFPRRTGNEPVHGPAYRDSFHYGCINIACRHEMHSVITLAYMMLFIAFTTLYSVWYCTDCKVVARYFDHASNTIASAAAQESDTRNQMGNAATCFPAT